MAKHVFTPIPPPADEGRRHIAIKTELRRKRVFYSHIPRLRRSRRRRVIVVGLKAGSCAEIEFPRTVRGKKIRAATERCVGANREIASHNALLANSSISI